MRLKLLVLLLVSLLLPTLVLAEVMTVSFSGAEIRSAPNAMASKVIAKVARYSPLTVVEKGSEYYKVKDYRGRRGWIHRSLLSGVQGVVITGDKANVRQGPGTNHPVSFQLSKGMAAKLLEKQEKWIRIQATDGKTGWVADFLVWGE